MLLKCCKQLQLLNICLVLTDLSIFIFKSSLQMRLLNSAKYHKRGSHNFRIVHYSFIRLNYSHIRLLSRITTVLIRHGRQKL